MENYIVLRIDKIKSKSQLSARLNHNYRVEENNNSLNNVDLTQSHKNKFLIGSNRDDVYNLFEEKINKEKQRKNAVFGVEFVISTSPDWFKTGNIEDFTNTALDFVKNEMGNDNVISAVLHLDESTPHLQFITLPLKNNKLNFKSFYKNKYDLEKLQDRAGKAFSNLGLLRGISKSISKSNNVNFRQYQNDVIEKKEELTALTEQKNKLNIELENIVKSLEKPQKDKKSYVKTAKSILDNLEKLKIKDFIFSKDEFINNIKNILLKSQVHQELFKLNNLQLKTSNENEILKSKLKDEVELSKKRMSKNVEYQKIIKELKIQNDTYLKYYNYVKNDTNILKLYKEKELSSKCLDSNILDEITKEEEKNIHLDSNDINFKRKLGF